MPKRKPVRQRKTIEWQQVIRLTASPAKLVGIVAAPDEETAREVAIEQFHIPPQHQRSLLIRRT